MLAGSSELSKYSPPSVDIIWLWLYYNKIPIYTIFYLLKGDCILLARVSHRMTQGIHMSSLLTQSPPRPSKKTMPNQTLNTKPGPGPTIVVHKEYVEALL